MDQTTPPNSAAHIEAAEADYIVTLLKRTHANVKVRARNKAQAQWLAMKAAAGLPFKGDGIVTCTNIREVES